MTTKMPPRQPSIAITAAGPICSIGIGRRDFREGLRDKREGIASSQRLTDTGRFTELAECWDFVIEDYLDTKKTYLDRCSEFAIATCALALADAGLDPSGLDGDRIGLALGTAFGCLESMANHSARIQTKGLRFGSPMIFTHTMPNSPTALAAIEHHIGGPMATFCAADISAAGAIQFALLRLATGDADYMLAGGCDALSTALLNGLPPPAAGATDFVPGEGACVLLLEAVGSATARGAEPLAEILAIGNALSTDAALRAACVQAGLADAPPVFPSPGAYGHTFAASVVLDICAAIEALHNQADTEYLAVIAPTQLTPTCGPSAAVILRKSHAEERYG
jgi:3-oxoacyl-[acyl-carrier-protein] synthase II